MMSSSENLEIYLDVIFNGSLSLNVFRESRRPFSWIIIILVCLNFRACLFTYPLINRLGWSFPFLLLPSIFSLPLCLSSSAVAVVPTVASPCRPLHHPKLVSRTAATLRRISAFVSSYLSASLDLFSVMSSSAFFAIHHRPP